MDIFISALISELKNNHKEVSIERTFPGGTLGIFFELSLDGKRKFVKTHQEGKTYKDNLLKEIEIISLLYKEVIQVDKIDIIQEGKQFTFMIMDFLYQVEHDIDTEEVKQCINKYQQGLLSNKINVKYTFVDIINAGKESLEVLYNNSFLSEKIYLMCKDSIEHIIRKNDEDTDLATVVCHGDLSNVNILYNESGQAVVIDWEDALLAFPEYDFLYWLTFFSQRKYYSADLFKRYNIDIRWGIDVMVLITIIKSAMAYRNGSYKNNSLSFEERIHEMYSIL